MKETHFVKWSWQYQCHCCDYKLGFYKHAGGQKSTVAYNGMCPKCGTDWPCPSSAKKVKFAVMKEVVERRFRRDKVRHFWLYLDPEKHRDLVSGDSFDMVSA